VPHHHHNHHHLFPLLIHLLPLLIHLLPLHPPLLHVCPLRVTVYPLPDISLASVNVNDYRCACSLVQLSRQLEGMFVACRLAPSTCYTLGGRRSSTVWPSGWAGIFVFTGSRATLAPTLQLSTDRVRLSGKSCLCMKLTALLYLALRQRTRGATPRCPRSPSCGVAKFNTEIIFYISLTVRLVTIIC
jgi:hypothetical protein